MKKRPERLIFINETGTTTKMTRLRGRCRRGQRLKMKSPFGHWGTQTSDQVRGRLYRPNLNPNEMAFAKLKAHL
jgi:hypothetical protein